jgi:hypothetical protein
MPGFRNSSTCVKNRNEHGSARTKVATLVVGHSSSPMLSKCRVVGDRESAAKGFQQKEMERDCERNSSLNFFEPFEGFVVKRNGLFCLVRWPKILLCVFDYFVVKVLRRYSLRNYRD